VALTAIAALVIFVRRKRQPGEPRTEAVSSNGSVDYSERGLFSNPLHQLVDESSQSGTLKSKSAAGPVRQVIAESSVDSLSAGQTKPGHVYQSIDDTNTGIYLTPVRLPRTREQSWDSTYWLAEKKGPQVRATLVGAPMKDLATANSAVAVRDNLPGSVSVATDGDA
jgi:hypothetical protein